MSGISIARSRRVQVASCLGFVIVLMDVSVVNVALEALRSGFHADMSGLQWVINAYGLAFAALLLMAGALGDRIGARRVFMMGFALFTLASLGCGLAFDLGMLLLARLLQGVGAALLVPNSLSLLRQVFHDPEARHRAVGWWGAGGGIALAAGPVVGGFLIAIAGWRSIFLVNLPIGALGLWLTARYAPVSPHHPGRGLDLSGQIAAALALACLTMALTEASIRGWTDPLILAGLAMAILLAALFIRLQTGNPSAMLPMSLFRDATVRSATAIGLIVNLAFYGGVFVLSLYFQTVRHFSPQKTGLAFLPMMATLVIMNIVAGRVIGRVGPHRLTAIGLCVSALGYLLLLPVSATGAYGALAVPMLLAGSGIALAIPTITNAILTSVPHTQAGIASGLLNSARQVGGMIGVALSGYLVRSAEPTLFMRGMHEAILVTVALLAAGALYGLLGLHASPDPKQEQQKSPEVMGNADGVEG
jgi:MFS transporter, DHA2 family, methylenomycin A resistance protein